jgi:hypothetical protein
MNHQKHLILLVWIMLPTVPIWGQLPSTTKFNLKAGLETWRFKDEVDLIGDSRHPGQMMGFEIHVQKQQSLFLAGIRYHRFSIPQLEKAFAFPSAVSEPFHYFSIGLSYGYQVWRPKMVQWTLLAGGEALFFYDISANSVGLDDDSLKGVSTALALGLQLAWFDLITTEIRFRFGLQPLVKNRDESVINGLTLGIGVML